MLIPAQLNPLAGGFPNDISRALDAIGSLLKGGGGALPPSVPTRISVQVTTEGTALPLRKRKRQIQQKRAELLETLADPSKAQSLFLDFMMSAYKLRVSEREQVEARLFQYPTLGLLTMLLLPQLRDVFGTAVNVELTADPNRLKLFVRLPDYPEQMLDTLAGLQETVDQVCEPVGHRLFLTTDLGIPIA